jgi:hypothetical protein
LCGKTIPRGKERLTIEIDERLGKIRVEVCGRCVARAVLEVLARRTVGEGRTDDTGTADGPNQNIDARTIDAAGAGAAAGSEIFSAADLPAWLAEGLRAAIRRKIAEESPARH